MRRSHNFGPPIQVVVARPSNSDTGLLNAWRFCSDERVRCELDKELVRSKELKDLVDKHNVKNGPYLASYRDSIARIERIKHLIRLRSKKVEENDVQNNLDIVD